MLPRKIFKIKAPRLAKNAIGTQDFSLEKLDKMSQHVALLLNLGVLKKFFAGFGGQLPPFPPPPTTNYGSVF